MAGETIKEFLVTLGFNVDESSFRKFNSAVASTTVPVLKLGAAVVATATAVEVMVEKTARQFEHLYYAAQNSRSTASGLQQVAFGAKQIGLEAGQGADMVADLARALREQPQKLGYLEALGVQTKDAKGNVLSTTLLLDGLIVKLSEMKSRALALRIASETYGLNPDVANQAMNNPAAFIKAQQDLAKIQEQYGLNVDDASNKGKDLAKSINALEASFKTLADLANVGWFPITDKMIGKTQALTNEFAAFNKEMHNTPAMATEVVVALGGVFALLGAISRIPYLGFIAKIFPLAGAAANVGLIHGLNQAAGEKANEALGLKKGWLADKLGIKQGWSANIPDLLEWANRRSGAPKPELPPGTPGGPEAPATAAPVEPTAPYKPNPSKVELAIPQTAPYSEPLLLNPAKGIRNNNPGNIQYTDSDGVSHERYYDTAYKGIVAMVGQLRRYASRGIDTIEKIINTYAPAKGAGNSVATVEGYIRDLVQKTGFGRDQHLDFNDPKVAEALTRSMIQHENRGQNPYSHEMLVAAIKEGRPDVTLNQSTTVNVIGTGDPKAVSTRVLQEQKRVNDEIARGMVGATQ